MSNKKNNPIITVLMPVYNGEKFLRKAIESILNQTFENFEFLIIDDGSTDNSIEIINSYYDPRIRLVKHKKNLRLVETLNHGLSLAKGKYIARMDCDDISRPKRLEKQLDFLVKHQDYVLVGCDCIEMDEDGKTIRYSAAFINDETLRSALAVRNVFAHGSVMYSKKHMLEIGKYNKKMFCAEDYEAWTRMCRVGKIATIPIPLFKYRINPDGLNKKYKKIQTPIVNGISLKYWRTFGSGGPAPKSKWKLIWPPKNQITPPIRDRRLTLSGLHLAFAQRYFSNDKNIILSIKHLYAAFKLQPFGLIEWLRYLYNGFKADAS